MKRAEMQAFVCVYRHPHPTRAEVSATRRDNAHDALVLEFVDRYEDADCYYDWGDDPAFFAATKALGTPSGATWGVCRRNVRRQLKPGDLVIWFCAKEGSEHGTWKYYFIGFGTVESTIDRDQLWSDTRFADYRSFYNVLAKPKNGELEQHETFHEYHKDWRKRITAPYVIFARQPSETRLDLSLPLYVAEKTPDSLVDIWRSDKDPVVKRLEQTLFERFRIARRLRSTHRQISHPHIAIHKCIEQRGAARSEALRRLKADLAQFVK